MSLEDLLIAAQLGDKKKARLAASGSIIGAVLASTCCIVPLILFSLGITGAWMGQLTALEPYKPVFIGVTLALLFYGFYLVYWKPKKACSEEQMCARPLPNKVVKTALWVSTVAIVIALAWPYILPLILG